MSEKEKEISNPLTDEQLEYLNKEIIKVWDLIRTPLLNDGNEFFKGLFKILYPNGIPDDWYKGSEKDG